MRVFNLLTGKVVIANSEGIEIATETMTPKADYAGVVADKLSEVPHILFFSETPVNKYSCQDEDAMVDMLAATRPDFGAVRKTEIPMEAVDGAKITLEDWALTMRLGIFAVPDVKDEQHLFNGVGIIRRE